MKEFTREDFQDIVERAENLAEFVQNGLWKRAYRGLADAADKLDAMEARTIDDKQAPPDKTKEIN